MKPLPTTLARGGFTFKQVHRSGHVAIFEQTKPGTTIQAYEVIIVRKRGECVAFGKRLEASEIYPRSEKWGELGWTYQNLDAAWDKFRELAQRKAAA